MKITEEMENIIHGILDDKIKDGTFVIHNINVLTDYLRQLSGYRVFALMCNNHIIFDIGRYYDDIEDFFWSDVAWNKHTHIVNCKRGQFMERESGLAEWDGEPDEDIECICIADNIEV